MDSTAHIPHSVPFQPDAPYIPMQHGFRLGKLGLLIPPGLYTELISRPPICAIPDTPDALLGFVNHRGDTLPVWDLERLMDPTQAGHGRLLLILGEGRQAYGLLLDSYPYGLTHLRATLPTSLPKEIEPFVAGAFTDGKTIWWEFDHLRFVAYLRRRFGTTE